MVLLDLGVQDLFSTTILEPGHLKYLINHIRGAEIAAVIVVSDNSTLF